MSLDHCYIPLEQITKTHHDGNIYEITNAAICRAAQLAVVENKTVKECEHRVIPAALKEVLDKKVQIKVETIEPDRDEFSAV